MTLMGVLVDLTYQLKVMPKIENLHQQHQSQLGEYLKNKEKYQKSDLFNPKDLNGENFALLLQRAVSKNDGESLVQPELKKEIFSLSEKWLAQKHKVQLPDNIKTLFRKILDYDQWQPVTELNTELATDLIVSCQLFLAYTYYFQPTASQEALRRVRHLSRILLQMEDLNFKRAGLSLLEKEREFISYINSRHTKFNLMWTPISNKELQTYRKFLNQTSQYLSYLGSPKLLDSVFLSEQPPIGFCSIIKSKTQLLNWSKKFLDSNFPFEPDFSETVSRIMKIKELSNSQCDLKQEQVIAEHGDIVSLIPYYRRLYAINMLLEADKMGQQ